MSIWEYKDRSARFNRALLGETACVFCGSKMESLPPKYKESRDHNLDVATQVASCPTCGWWKLIWLEQEIQAITQPNPHPQDIFDDGLHRWSFAYGAIGSLRELDLTDISQPIEDVRAYLLACYEKRFEVHPRLFEETVASVFRNLGYHARVTSYTGDGGIDVILDGTDGKIVGVQVKRYKNSISVEQIRSLAGALYIGGYTKGIFVTTSRFQSGSQKTSNLSALRGIPIELIDADKFYAAMKIAQRERYKFKDEPMTPFFNITTDQLIPLDLTMSSK